MELSNKIWNNLLRLKNSLKDYTSHHLKICIYLKDDKITIDEISAGTIYNVHLILDSKSTNNFILNDKLSLSYCKSIDPEILAAYKTYLPILLGPNIAKDHPFVFIHAAQSLDGKLATNQGNSVGIGNKENLIHCHRLRALSDAILVGGNTLKNDQSRLNVRHVDGDDPIRVIVSKSRPNFTSLLNASNQTIIWVHNADSDLNNLPSQVKSIATNCTSDIFSTAEVVKLLAKEDIKSLFIEGGSKTIKHFIQDKSVDYLQIHIAPIIFGSGLNSFNLEPNISQVQDGLKLKHVVTTQIGNSMMYSGYLK